VAYFRIIFGISLERPRTDIKKLPAFWQRHISLREVVIPILHHLIMNLTEPQVTYLHLTSNVFILSK
jgi:hypothetical protein